MARFSTILCKQFLVVFLGFAGHVKLNDRNSRGDEFMWMEGLDKFWCWLSCQSMHPVPLSAAWFSAKTSIHGLCQVHLTAFRQLATSVHHSCGILVRGVLLFLASVNGVCLSVQAFPFSCPPLQIEQSFSTQDNRIFSGM